MQKEWTALLTSEAAYALNPASCKIMTVIRWRHYKSIRMLYLMAEEMGWKVTPKLQQYMKDMLGGLADTKIIEDTHQKLRDLARQQRNFVSSRVKRMFSCMTSGQLGARHTKVLPAIDPHAPMSWHACKFVKTRKMTQTAGLKLKNPHYQMIMHPKTQASTSPEGLFTAAAATEWMFLYWQLDDSVPVSLDHAWQSILVDRLDIARHIPTSKTVLVVGCSGYAFQSWKLVPLKQQDSHMWIMEVGWKLKIDLKTFHTISVLQSQN